jgi:hypothetical protein
MAVTRPHTSKEVAGVFGVVSANHWTTPAGRDGILERGGNAFDDLRGSRARSGPAATRSCNSRQLSDGSYRLRSRGPLVPRHIPIENHAIATVPCRPERRGQHKRKLRSKTDKNSEHPCSWHD